MESLPNWPPRKIYRTAGFKNTEKQHVKNTGCDLGLSIPGRQRHESHGIGSHGTEFFADL
jgi:hypothetical protein